MAFRALSFDLFDTLVDMHMELLPAVEIDGVLRRGTEPALHAHVSTLAPISLREFSKTLAAVDRELRQPLAAEGRELSSLERFHELARRLGLGQSDLSRELTRIHMGLVGAQARHVPHHPELLAELHRHQRIGVCSNFSHAPTARRVLDESGLTHSVDAIVISDEIGRRKPHAEIFVAVLGALGTAPAETLHVGDRLGADVEGPAALGMRTAWLTRRVSDPQRALAEYTGKRPDFILSDLRELPALLASES